MSFFSITFRTMASIMDKKRDKHLKEPEGIEARRDIPYAQGGKYNLLDVYFPKGTDKKLPVIVSIHGGGYVYGTKAIYVHYGMFLAAQGFTVVNFNYHLAPGHKFPVQLCEINMVMDWMVKHSEEYHMDLNHLFLVGDSAGAQMTSHYSAIYSNPSFAGRFPFQIPDEIQIRAVGLNCGMYDISAGGREIFQKQKQETGLDAGRIMDDYLGKDAAAVEHMLQVKENITSDFPPAFVMTSYYDFLKDMGKPMHELLKSKGVETQYRLYGEDGQKYMGHVFHCNMNLQEAKDCNLEECNFFRKFIAT